MLRTEVAPGGRVMEGLQSTSIPSEKILVGADATHLSKPLILTSRKNLSINLKV